jgi:hypothetical protein
VSESQGQRLPRDFIGFFHGPSSRTVTESTRTPGPTRECAEHGQSEQERRPYEYPQCVQHTGTWYTGRLRESINGPRIVVGHTPREVRRPAAIATVRLKSRPQTILACRQARTSSPATVVAVETPPRCPSQNCHLADTRQLTCHAPRVTALLWTVPLRCRDRWVANECSLYSGWSRAGTQSCRVTM